MQTTLSARNRFFFPGATVRLIIFFLEPAFYKRAGDLEFGHAAVPAKVTSAFPRHRDPRLWFNDPAVKGHDAAARATGLMGILL